MVAEGIPIFRGPAVGQISFSVARPRPGGAVPQALHFAWSSQPLEPPHLHSRSDGIAEELELGGSLGNRISEDASEAA
jgi:hypothetical protein